MCGTGTLRGAAFRPTRQAFNSSLMPCGWDSPALGQMSPRKIQNVSNRHRLVTVSLSATEFSWLNDFVAILESAGYRRTRSAVVSVALAELRSSIGKASPEEMLKHWLRRDTKRLIAAIDGNPPKTPRINSTSR